MTGNHPAEKMRMIGSKPAMTSKDILYRVTADNGLSGLAVGCEAANVLCDEMGQRPDVESVEATPLASDEEMEHYLMFPDAYCRGCESGAGPLCIDCMNRDETLEFLGHGEQL